LNPWEVLKPGETHWWLLLDQMTNCLAMIAVVAMTILLNASGLELATMTDAKLDRELEAAGAANVAAGAFGGMVGYLSISRSLLNFEAGGKSRLSGLVAAGCCAALLVWGPSALLYIPKPVLGGLLCYLGLALLVEWLVDARHRLSRFDYFLVVTILLFVSIWDFLTAVGLGTVIACLLFAFNYSRVRVVKHAMSCKEHRSKVVRSLREQELLEQEGERIGIFCLQGFIFFGTVSNLLTDITERLTNKERPHLDYLLLDFRLVLGVDSSATLSFLKLKRLANSHHFMLIFTGVNETTKAKLVQAGCINEGERWCRLFPDLDRGLEFCENLLLVELTGMTSQSVSLRRQLTQVFDNPERLPRLLAYMEKVSLPKGLALFHQGDEADALYFVESGKLTVTLHLPRNRTKRLATIGPGAIVGEIGLFLNRPRSASVLTEQSVVLYKLTHASFLELQVKEPELALAFQQAVIGLLSRRLMQANKELDILLK
jgi:SulP family sulfate permease